MQMKVLNCVTMVLLRGLYTTLTDIVLCTCIAKSNFQLYNHLKMQKQVINIMQTKEIWQHTENKQKDVTILKKMKIICSCNTNLMLTIHFVAQKVQEILITYQ